MFYSSMSSPQEKILTKFLWDEEYIKWNKNKSKVNIQNLNLVLFTFFFWVNLHHIDFVCLIDNFGLIRALSVFFHIFYFADHLRLFLFFSFATFYFFLWWSCEGHLRLHFFVSFESPTCCDRAFSNNLLFLSVMNL